MAITWRQLIGSTERFAIEMSLIPNPDDGGYASPDLLASWGEFKVFVEGRNLCEARDSTGIILEGVRWFLMPLLTFFVRNWEPLMHRGRLPCTSRSGTSGATQMASTASPPLLLRPPAVADWDDAWWQFFSEHCLASAREGGLFPNIWFRRISDDIEISWDNDSNPAEAPIRFSDRRGEALIPVGEFAELVGGIVAATLDELSKRVESPELVELRQGLEAIREPSAERRWLRHGLLLDLRRNLTEAIEFAKHLAELQPALAPYQGGGTFAPSALPSLVFASIAPNVTEKDALTILSEFEKSRGHTAQTPLVELYDEMPCPFAEPWRSGHELALRLRNKLSLGVDAIDVEEVITGLEVSVREIELSDPGIRAISFIDEDVVPTILINRLSPRTRRGWSRAATLAHELCHLFFDRRLLGKTLGIASGRWAPVRFEQRANAFAVMFLMPDSRASEIFEDATGGVNERVKNVAKYFGASFRATVEHLSNIGLIERYERESLLEDLGEWSL